MYLGLEYLKLVNMKVRMKGYDSAGLGRVLTTDQELQGVSNRWTGIWNRTMEWKMEWNSEHTQLQVTHVTDTAQSRLNYLVYLQACYLTAEAL